jgi:signal transduction histidine kinase
MLVSKITEITTWDKTPHFHIWFKEGIIHMDYQGEVGAELAQESIQHVENFLNENKLDKKPIIVNLKNVSNVTFKARRYFAQYGPNATLALALISNSPMETLIANIFMTFSRPNIPVKLFNQKSTGIDWLKENYLGSVDNKKVTYERQHYNCSMDQEGIVHCNYCPNVNITTEIARENINFISEKFQQPGKKLRIIANIQDIKGITREAREIYSGDVGGSVAEKVAIITNSLTSNIIANIMIKMNPTQHEVKLFDNREDAKNWLLNKESISTEGKILTHEEASYVDINRKSLFENLLATIAVLALLLATYQLISRDFQSGSVNLIFSLFISSLYYKSKISKQTDLFIHLFLLVWHIGSTAYILVTKEGGGYFIIFFAPISIIGNIMLPVNRGLFWFILSNLIIIAIGTTLNDSYWLLSPSNDLSLHRPIYIATVVCLNLVLYVFGYQFTKLSKISNQAIKDNLDLAEKIVGDSLNLLTSYSALDFSKKLKTIEGKNDVFSQLSMGINLLGEELEDSITQLKMTENTKRLAAMGEMASGISHEVNTPLASIKLSSGILEKELEKDSPDLIKIRKLVNNISITSTTIAKIIKSLKTISRDSENDPLTPEMICNLIEDIEMLTSYRSKKDSIVIVINNSIQDDEMVCCRPSEIVQVIVNLINNAMDAVETNKNEKLVELSIYEEGEWINFCVSDNGPGISPEDLKHLFDPFFTTKEIGKGTGLGLSISKRIAESHGGNILVTSDKGLTKFTLEIPFNRDIKDKKNCQTA